MEIVIDPMSRIDANVYRAEEKICAISETHLRIAVAIRQTRKTADIGDGYRFPPTVRDGRIILVLQAGIHRAVGILRLMVRPLRPLAAEQESRVNTPIDCDRLILIAADRCRRIPRERRPYSVKIVAVVRHGEIVMMVDARRDRMPWRCS